ncbi:MAG: DNA repair protein RadC [Bacilli bacterium]
MKISDLPNSEKPRERLIKYGVSNLSNEDLISIIIRNGIKNQNVKILSNQILSKIKSIDKLSDLSINELCQIKGIGKIKAVTLLASIELGKRVNNKDINHGILINNTDLVHKYFSHLIGNKNQEEILVILLDYKKRLISYKLMYKGTNSASLASTKEIFNYAIKENADAVILMHNHPSGLINPSVEDIKLTNTLIETGKIIGIPLIDHLITNGQEYYSFFNEMVK